MLVFHLFEVPIFKVGKTMNSDILMEAAIWNSTNAKIHWNRISAIRA